MILRVTPQRSGITIGLAAALRFALERLLVPMCQHVAVPVGGERGREGDLLLRTEANTRRDICKYGRLQRRQGVTE